MNKQSNVKTLVLALGLLSLSGLAHAGKITAAALTVPGANPAVVLSSSAADTAKAGDKKHDAATSRRDGDNDDNGYKSENGDRGHAYGRCKEGKRNKHCASPS